MRLSEVRGPSCRAVVPPKALRPHFLPGLITSEARAHNPKQVRVHDQKDARAHNFKGKLPGHSCRAVVPPEPLRPHVLPSSSISVFVFLCVTLEPGIERCNSICALNTSPPRNRCTFLLSRCFQIEHWCRVEG